MSYYPVNHNYPNLFDIKMTRRASRPLFSDLDSSLDEIIRAMPPEHRVSGADDLRSSICAALQLYRRRRINIYGKDVTYFFGRKLRLTPGWESTSRGPLLVFTSSMRPVIVVPNRDGAYSPVAAEPRWVATEEFCDYGFQLFEETTLSRPTYSRFLALLIAYITKNIVGSSFTFIILSGLAVVPALMLYRLATANDVYLRAHVTRYLIVIAAYLATLPFYSWLYNSLATSSYVRVQRELVPSFWDKLLRATPLFWAHATPQAVEESFSYALTQREVSVSVLFPVIVAVGQLAWAFRIIAYYSSNWCLLALGFVIIRLVVAIVFVVRKSSIEYKLWIAGRERTSIAQEMIQAITTIKAYGAEAAFGKRLRDASNIRINSAARLQMISLVSNMAGGGFLLYSGLWLWLLGQHSNGSGSVAVNIVLFTVFTQLLMALTRIEVCCAFFSQFSLANRKLNPVLQAWAQPETTFSSSVDSNLTLELRAVEFGYSPECPLLRNVSFCMHSGEVVGLVGPSGSGKTTLIHLILGFIAPVSGDVLWNGLPVHKLHRALLRRKFAVVLQGSYPGGGTIRDALTVSAEYADDVLWSALALAAFEEEVRSMPLQLATPIGDRGSMLSGGQRQRLLIAAALVKKPAFIILDEAMSSLDSDNVRRIMSNLKMYGAPTLVVAHRADALAGASQVIDLGRSPASFSTS